MQTLSRWNKSIVFAFFALPTVAFTTVTNVSAQNLTYGGQMTLSWTIDTFSCPTGIFCPGQQLIETSASGSEIIPLSADYSSCSTSAVGSGPTVAPVGIGAPDIVFILPNDANTCPVLFYPGAGAFWYQGDITTPDGSFPVVPAVEEFTPALGELDVLSVDSTGTHPTDLTFNATGLGTVCDGPFQGVANCDGFGYADNSWSFSGELTACRATYRGTFNGNLTISKGLTCVINGTINGNVMQNGGGLFASNATIEGNLQISGRSKFSIESTAIYGNLQIQNIPAGAAQNEICGTNVNGKLQFNNNGTAVAIGTTSASCPGNTIGGNMQINRNIATVQVSDDTVKGSVQCQGNYSITGGGDTAQSLQGQCAAF